MSVNGDDRYAQNSKNTVNSLNQLKENRYVTFENPQGKGKRVMFVGNSMTLHGIKESIGWNNEFGMAASAKEKDYVHLIMKKIRETDNDAAFCICQVARWESEYKQGEKTFELYNAARDFDADIIIFRIIENCPVENFDKKIFAKQYKKLIDFLASSKKIVVTTGFWRHPGDDAICEVAEERNYPLVQLGDLGEDDKMKAIGLFEHSGVANHPGDKGMEMIAIRIMEKLSRI